MIFKGYERIDAPDVYDGLDSTSTEMALSARQGNILNEKINQAVSNALLATHPIGSLEINTSGTNPSEYLGGVWESFGSGRTLVGVDSSDSDFDTAEETGGEKTHTLTVAEMPKHKHLNGYKFRDGSGSSWGYRVTSGAKEGNTDGTSDGETGGGKAHNNLQPYITVYFWKRIN